MSECAVRVCANHPKHTVVQQQDRDGTSPRVEVECFTPHFTVGEVQTEFAAGDHKHLYWSSAWATTPQAIVTCANYKRCSGCERCQPLPEWFARQKGVPE